MGIEILILIRIFPLVCNGKGGLGIKIGIKTGIKTGIHTCQLYNLCSDSDGYKDMSKVGPFNSFVVIGMGWVFRD